jgi:hypothetical protein
VDSASDSIIDLPYLVSDKKHHFFSGILVSVRTHRREHFDRYFELNVAREVYLSYLRERLPSIESHAKR